MTTSLRDLALAATNGPWTRINSSWEYDFIRPTAGGARIATVHIDDDVTEETQDALEPIKDANAAYIAAAHPQAVLALLDRIAELEGALRQVMHDFEHCDWECEHCGKDHDMRRTDIYAMARAALNGDSGRG